CRIAVLGGTRKQEVGLRASLRDRRAAAADAEGAEQGRQMVLQCKANADAGMHVKLHAPDPACWPSTGGACRIPDRLLVAIGAVPHPDGSHTGAALPAPP